MKSKPIFKMFYKILCDKCGRISRKIWRNKYERKKLNNNNFTIFSQNCIGGIMYNDLGIQFKSPTVNMLFEPKQFIKFMKNIEWYLEQKIIFVQSNTAYPIGKLGDIDIKFLHYHSEKEVVRAWEERKKRINWENIFVICCDEGLTYEDMREFDELPYNKKILFVHKTKPGISSAVVVNDFENKTDARLLNFSNLLGKRYYQKYIDYIGWLNQVENKN